MTIHNLVSFAGIFVLLAFAWLCSANRRVVNWRAVVWGTALSLAFALIIFVVPAGTKVFLVVNDVVVKVLDFCGVNGKWSRTSATSRSSGRRPVP